MVTMTFWVEPTQIVRLYLKRFTWRELSECPKTPGLGHMGRAFAEERAATWGVRNDEGKLLKANPAEPQRILANGWLNRFPPDDPRWPGTCDACGAWFSAAAARVIDVVEVYAAEDGRLFESTDLPPGAMYDAWWLPEEYHGSDGIALAVVTPDGFRWHVDAMAHACPWALKEHRCWGRLGDPKSGKVSVMKPAGSCTAQRTGPLWAGQIIDGELIAA